MNMNMKKLALAVASTLVAGHAFAAAVTAADVRTAASATPSTLEQVWLSGASAPTANLYAAFKRDCHATNGSIAIFTAQTKNDQPGSLGDYSAYACKRGDVTTVLYHTVAGGSFNAYAPHLPNDGTTAPDGSALPAQLSRVKYVGTASMCSNSGTVSKAGAAFGDQIYWNCATVTPGVAGYVSDTAPDLPQIGISDVEAGLWGYDVSAIGDEAKLGITQGFGIAVTAPLYRALQVAQFGATNASYNSLANAAVADPSFSPLNAPNITSAQYAAIVRDGGDYQADWSKLLGTTYAELKSADHNVNLQRRVATSGTQASSNAYFLGTKCLDGTLGGQLLPAGSDRNTASFRVVQQSSSSTLKNDLEALAIVNADNSTVTGDASTARKVNGVAQNYGIAVLSLENSAGTAKGWMFTKLDGVHPEQGETVGGAGKARAAIMDGSYKFSMEMRSFVPAASSGTYAETLLGEITNQILNPETCSDVGRGMALTADSGTSCAIGVSKAKGTKQGNNCGKVELWN